MASEDTALERMPRRLPVYVLLPERLNIDRPLVRAEILREKVAPSLSRIRDPTYRLYLR